MATDQMTHERVLLEILDQGDFRFHRSEKVGEMVVTYLTFVHRESKEKYAVGVVLHDDPKVREVQMRESLYQLHRKVTE